MNIVTPQKESDISKTTPFTSTTTSTITTPSPFFKFPISTPKMGFLPPQSTTVNTTNASSHTITTTQVSQQDNEMPQAPAAIFKAPKSMLSPITVKTNSGVNANNTPIDTTKKASPMLLNNEPKSAKKRKVRYEPGAWKCARCKDINIPELKYCISCLCKMPIESIPLDDVEME